MTRVPRYIPAAQRGFTMIELTVSLLLGLLVVGAAGSIFLSNQRVYGSTEAINRIQENQRSAFEMLARDIREAGTNPCLRFTATVQPVMQINPPDTATWARFANAISGVDGSGAGGSDEITLYSGAGTVYSVSQHRRSTDPLTVSTPTAGIANGQQLMVCNTDNAIAFSATNVVAGGTTIGHDTPSNCGKSLTPRPDSTQCTQTAAGPGYCFWLGAPATAADVTSCPGGIGNSPAFVVVPVNARWTVATNGRGSNSLWRTVGTGAPSEIAEGVSAVNLTYKIGNSANYVDASAVTDWAQVSAVHVQMTFQAVTGALSANQIKGTDNNALSRQLDDYIVLRNHQDIQ
ncbi:prepilin-type N-terminal cleavage/methylation domain-containing protein [Lysobacter sp. TY2-98]|uniref:prepilin-type N-terminal cleavage/methylation domain-containing protein n=1 Tax=Lysobacter sp. TY2-98 TaxID=2290922 RepID=UPI000E2030AD|nr:prepilin-type N-terminal cleavage/methylation domain-containing protein [Lysobacter sp. TY2-98]AXK71485.1 prepilin-type N-terminal cleavage/methylation domain-containing protein [Lysobacter sp. TY2-98]